MDVGRGEVVRLPQQKSDTWWKGTTGQRSFMATDLGITRDTPMAHDMSSHVAVACGDVFNEMVTLSQALGFNVSVLSRK